MIIFTTENGRLHECEWRGKRYRTTNFSALSDLARQLKADGCENQPWELIWSFEPQRATLRGPHLDWLAEHVLTEQGGRLRWARWRPNAPLSEPATRRHDASPASNSGEDTDAV